MSLLVVNFIFIRFVLQTIIFWQIKTSLKQITLCRFPQEKKYFSFFKIWETAKDKLVCARDCHVERDADGRKKGKKIKDFLSFRSLHTNQNVDEREPREKELWIKKT